MSINLEFQNTFSLTTEELGNLANSIVNKKTPVDVSANVKKAVSVEANNHFSVACRMGESIMSGLDTEMKAMVAPHAVKKLASKIYQGFASDQTTLSLSSNKEGLKYFEFNANNPYHSGINFTIHLKQGANKGRIILHIPAFTPNRQLNVPKKATNFKISAVIVSVSDFQQKEKKCTLVNPIQHERNGRYQTIMLPILKMPTDPITFQLGIGHQPVYEITTVLVVAIKFYCYANAQFNLMPSDGVMQIMHIG